MVQPRKTAARKLAPKPSASGALGGPAAGAGFIYQVNFAVCKLLQLCAEFLSFPLKDPTIQVEVRAIGGDAGATRWDLGLEAAGQLIETKLHPDKQDLSEWLLRTLSQFRDGADGRQSVFVFGRTSGRRLVSLKHLIRNANEAGADETKFRALVEVEDVAEAPSLLQELGERPREMLQRMKLVDLSEASLSDEIDLYCRVMAGPERGEELRDLLYRRVSEAVPHRATIHVRELVQAAGDRGIDLAPIPKVSLQGSSAFAFEWFGCGCSHRHALALAHASEGYLPPLKWSCRRNGKGEAQRRSAQAKRGRLGKPLVRASGAEP